MNTKMLVGVLAVAGLAIAVYALLGGDAKVEFATRLGTPGNGSPDASLPELPMHIEFDEANSRIISGQQNGDIVAWDINSGARTELANTTGLFAYCRDRNLLLLHDQEGVILKDIKDDKRQLVIEGIYHHAAWNGDCSAFTIANRTAKEVKRWRTADLSNHIVLYTAEPVRNGLAMSDAGNIIAAAEGSYADATGHDTKLEVFVIADNDGYSRNSPKADGATILGMWQMAFTPDGQSLIVPSHTNGQSGLRSLVAHTAGERWRKEAFQSYWVRAIATSPDNKLIATGDDKGWLRIWSARNGALDHELQTGQAIQSASFSDNGNKLAVALWDSTIAILDLSEF